MTEEQAQEQVGNPIEDLRLAISTPGGKITPTRAWNLRMAEAYAKHGRTIFQSALSKPWEGMLLMPLLNPQDIIELRDKFQPKPDDVFVATYPKCGTTWMQQIVKLIWNNGEEDGRDIDEALPWIELMDKPQDVETMASPRGFKTHLPYHLCPGGDPTTSCAKYIHVYRNPKDAIVSNFHFIVKFLPDDIPWTDYFQMMMTGNAFFGNIFDHIKEWYIHKDSPNILSISYESLKRTPHESVKTVANFLGYDLSDEVISKIVQATTFESMKGNELANNSWMAKVRREGTAFMRKGIVGDWKTLFTDEQSAQVDAMAAEKLKDVNLVFDYEDN